MNVEIRLILARRQPLVAALLALFLTPGTAAARVHLGSSTPAPSADGTSEEPESPWGVAARVGYFGGAVLGGGLEAYRRLGAWELGLSGEFGSADLTSSVSDLVNAQLSADAALGGYQVTDLKASSAVVAAFGRYFVQDSFACTAGLGYRRIDGRINLAATSGGGEMTADATAGSLVLVAAVGNHWSWPGGLSLGIDWLGVTLPLAVTSHVSTGATGNAPGAAQTALQTEAKSMASTLGWAPALILLLGSVGLRF